MPFTEPPISITQDDTQGLVVANSWTIDNFFVRACYITYIIYYFLLYIYFYIYFWL